MNTRPAGQPIAYSRHERPHGQPGEVSHTRARKVREWVGDPDGIDGEYRDHYVTYGVTYPAVQEPNDGDLWIWRDSETAAAGWIRGTGWIEYFEPGPEWQAQCQHQHGAVWRPCTTEAECDALAREETDR